MVKIQNVKIDKNKTKGVGQFELILDIFEQIATDKDYISIFEETLANRGKSPGWFKFENRTFG